MLRNLFIYSVFMALAACGGGSTAVKNNSSYVSANSSSAASSSLIASSVVASSASSMALSSASSLSDVAAENMYGLYVSLRMGRSDQLLGNAQREEQFINFVRDGGFTYLLFYELEGLNPTSVKAQQFASLISRARSIGGVKQIGAALGDASEADTIVAYNNGRPDSERINVLNVEYEFWNKTDRKTEFAKTISMLEQFKRVAMENRLTTEIYVGWIDAMEAVTLANVTDRILVHYYMQTDATIINFGLERLEWLSAASRKVKIAPIFSNEGPKNTNDLPFMGCWLEKNPHQQAYRSWKAQYDALDKPWKANIEVVGSVWFIYDKFLDVGTSTSGCTK